MLKEILLEIICFLDNQGILLGRLQLHSGMLSNFAKQLEHLEIKEGMYQHLSKHVGGHLLGNWNFDAENGVK